MLSSSVLKIFAAVVWDVKMLTMYVSISCNFVPTDDTHVKCKIAEERKESINVWSDAVDWLRNLLSLRILHTLP